MSRTPLFRLLPVLFVAAVVAAACSSSSPVASDETADEETVTTDVAVEEADEQVPTTEAETTDTAEGGASAPAVDPNKPEVVVPDGPAPTALETTELIAGEGKAAQAGDFLTMHYVGVLHADGSQFDASWDRGATFNFTLGAGQVITGWDQGIEGMQVGGRRLLSIPPEQAYGAASPSPDIPANSALVFVVDLLGAASPVESIENAPNPVTELVVEVIEEGTGPEITAGQVVEIHFVAIDQATGDLIDNSWLVGQPAQFVVGVDPIQTLQGWNDGILGANIGDRLRIVIPPGMGIPDGSGVMTDGGTLVTDVTILSAR